MSSSGAGIWRWNPNGLGMELTVCYSKSPVSTKRPFVGAAWSWLDERGLASSTARAYVFRARRFVAECPRRPTRRGDDRRRYSILAESTSLSVGAAQFFVAALRSFLRFCSFEGLVAEAEIKQLHTAWIGQAVLAVHAAVDDEAMQMLAIPVEGCLQRGVQVGDGAVAADEQASPDQRAYPAQKHAQLVGDTGSGGKRLRHFGHHGPRRSLTGSPSPTSAHSRALPGRLNHKQGSHRPRTRDEKEDAP